MPQPVPLVNAEKGLSISLGSGRGPDNEAPAFREVARKKEHLRFRLAYSVCFVVVGYIKVGGFLGRKLVK